MIVVCVEEIADVAIASTRACPRASPARPGERAEDGVVVVEFAERLEAGEGDDAVSTDT